MSSVIKREPTMLVPASPSGHDLSAVHAASLLRAPKKGTRHQPGHHANARARRILQFEPEAPQNNAPDATPTSGVTAFPVLPTRNDTRPPLSGAASTCTSQTQADAYRSGSSKHPPLSGTASTTAHLAQADVQEVSDHTMQVIPSKKTGHSAPGSGASVGRKISRPQAGSGKLLRYSSSHAAKSLANEE